LDREDDIRAQVQPLIDRLYELYEATDPSKGPASELGKLQIAQRAIHIWWHVYGKLLLWAQSQIVGYEIAREYPKVVDELAKRRGHQVNEDSHELELLGLGYAWNPPVKQQERVDALTEAPEAAEGDLTDAVLRRVMSRLLLSTEANSSFWRYPFSNALRAANAGERDELFEPAKTRRRGRPYQLDSVRAIAVAHVYYLLGKGIRKHIALGRVSDALPVSVETLRDWEKALGHDDWFDFDWRAARLAGALEQEIKEKSPMALEQEYGADYLGSTSNFTEARLFIQRMTGEWSLENVKANLRRFHGGGDENQGA
jgi:hypothetical protein